MSVFFDTSILLYADDADAGAKTSTARELLRRSMVERTGVVSTQVLQEFYVIARRKLQLDGAAARARIEIYLGFDVVTVTPALLLAAVDLNRLDSVSFWDALVVRAAERAAISTPKANPTLPSGLHSSTGRTARCTSCSGRPGAHSCSTRPTRSSAGTVRIRLATAWPRSAVWMPTGETISGSEVRQPLSVAVGHPRPT